MKHFPHRSTRQLTTRRASASLVAAVAIAALVVPGAGAAASDAQTQNFCSQIRASQSAIASVTTTGQAKNKRIAQEWTKIERVAPSTVKVAVTAIRTAYVTAATQNDTQAAATLKAITTQAKSVTAFVSANCSQSSSGGPGGAPVDEAAMAKITACMAKEGVTMPTRAQGGQPGSATPGSGSRVDFDDPKFQAAAKKCGFALGGGRGGDAGGGLDVTPEMQACLKAKGVTWPPVATGATTTTKKGATTTKASGSVSNATGGGATEGRGRPGSFRGMDDKTRAAFEACRTQTQSSTTKKS